MTAGRFVLAALLAALLGAAFFVETPVAPPLEEATLLLQTASLAADRDLEYDERDVARFRARGWAPATRIALGFDADGTHRFERPLAYPLLAAPFEAVAPGRGALVLNVLLLALASGLAVWFLWPVMGESASWLVAAAVFGSATFGYALSPRPEALLVGAVVAVFALGWPRAADTRALGPAELPAMRPRRPGEAESEDDVDAPAGRRAAASIGRWLGVGLLLGVVAAHHPLLLLLIVPLFAGVEPRQRSAAIPAVVLGVLAVLVVAWLVGGFYAEFQSSPKLAIAADGLESLAARGASPVSGADLRPSWPPRLTEYGLHGRNLFYFVAGRHIGLLIYFLPLLLLLRLGAGAAPRRWAILTSLASVAALFVLFPFELGGGPGPGNRWFLPLYAVFLLTPLRPVGRVSALVLLLVGGGLMAPMWFGQAPAEAGPAVALFDRLPFETTQRSVPVAAEVVRRGVRVRAASAAIGAGGGGYPMSLAAGRKGQIMVVADGPVSFVDLTFDRRAVGDPSLSGAELHQMTFRPDGTVTFRLRPGRAIRHSTWWSAAPQLVYMISVAMPETPVDLPFGVSVE